MAKKKEKDAYTASDPYVPQTYGHEEMYKAMVEEHGVAGANKIISQMQREKEKLKKENWPEYKSRYCGRVR